MLLLSLDVKDLRLLRDVHLTFGKRLNVIYGPNDIGKSSLAEALRVAFLLPHTSTAGEHLKPWGTDRVPSVVVKFKMKDATWQITKGFAPGGGGNALLERVDESGILHEEARGRAVEGRLREIVAWGIPAPGGRGGPRGLPESYLATALLGRQDQVTAILEASPEEDGDGSGLRLVTAALGAFGQDPLVGQLLERLQERTGDVFTEGGQLRQAKDSPLVQVAAKVKEQQEQLDILTARVCQSTEIEKKLRALSGSQIVADEKCRRLVRRVALVQMVEEAEGQCRASLAREQSLEEARRDLAVIQERLRETESACQQGEAARSSIESDFHKARGRLAKAEGALKEVRKNAQQSHDARRTVLISRRDAANRRAQRAHEVIQAGEQVQARKHELALAAKDHEQARQDELRARNRAKLAMMEAELCHAHRLAEHLKIATRARDDAAADLKDAEQAWRTAEAGLADAERALKLQTKAAETAEQEAIQRRFQEEAVRARLSRLQIEERDTAKAGDRIKSAVACSERLVKAQEALADVETRLRDLETKVARNAERTRECDARAGAPTPMPLQAALFVALLGGVIGVALGIGLQVPAGIIAGAIVGSSVLAAAVAVFVLRARHRLRTLESARRESAHLTKEREDLVERRNQVLMERGLAQVRADSVRSEYDRDVAVLGQLDSAIAKIGLELVEVRRKLDEAHAELRTLEGQQLKCNAFDRRSVEAVERQVGRLKEDFGGKVCILDAARQQAVEAQLRFEAAASSAALVDLTSLEQRVNAARMDVNGETANDLETGQAQHERAKEALAERETAVRVARGLLADAQSGFEAMPTPLGQAPEAVLTEAEKEYESTNEALENLENLCSEEADAAEAELREAQAEVARLDAEQARAHAEAEATIQARDQSRLAHAEAQAKLNSLATPVQTVTLAEANAALTLARRRLEADSAGSEVWPDNLAAVESVLEVQRAQLRTTKNELQEARGQLKVVGGTVAREQHDQVAEALDGLKKVAQDVEDEYRAARYLLDVLKAEEEKQAAHLGRSLAKPVTEIFTDFTSGRYGQVVLDSSLRFQGVMVKGSERDLESLSVGTRDQLATLVRLALAAHLKSVVVLDDQLAQSDPVRAAWFRDRLRASVRDHEHQIIIITCRPLDYLHAEEMPTPPAHKLETDHEILAAVDFAQLIG